MSSQLVSDFMLERLREWGVERVYGYPGDGINGILGAFDRASRRPEFIQVRHEEMAAFMACAHAKFTGEVGVCMATSGPGAIHLLNGLYDAKMDHQPVVAIVGQQATRGARRQLPAGGRPRTRSSRTSPTSTCTCCTDPVAGPPPGRPRDPHRARPSGRVTCVIVPNDVQEQEAVPKPPHEHGTVHSGRRATRRRGSSRDRTTSQRAAEVLNAGKKVAMLVGAGRAGRRARR